MVEHRAAAYRAEFAAKVDMARADTLVTAQSTFSYMAGILNPGQVFYEPFWHEPLPRWHVIGADRGILREKK